jgi:hypothetical protein
MGMNSDLHIAIEGMPLTGIRDFQLGGLLQPLTVTTGGYNHANKSLYVSGLLAGEFPFYVSLDSDCRVRDVGLHPKDYSTVLINGINIVGLGIEVLPRFVNRGLRVFNSWDMYLIPEWNLCLQLDAEDLVETMSISFESLNMLEWDGTI